MDMARVGSGSGSGIGDPSFIGIARPVDLADPNLTATWKKARARPTFQSPCVLHTQARGMGRAGCGSRAGVAAPSSAVLGTNGSNHRQLCAQTTCVCFQRHPRASYIPQY